MILISFPYHRQARQLIEKTIQRNASPVLELESSRRSDMASQKEDDAAVYPSPVQQSGRQSLNMDSILDEYQYTVTVADQSIKITGKSLALVQVISLSHFSFY